MSETTEGQKTTLKMMTGAPVEAPVEPLYATGAPAPVVQPGAELVTVTVDGKPMQVPKGTNLLEACNQAGADVPFFCYHPGLSSPAVCRQCLVDVKGQPKLVPSCYTPVADKMEVTTASPRVLDIRRQMLEFTLLNHPIDCPICDKAGECTLQKQYFDWDAKYARNDGIKVHKAKHVDIGKHIVLDQERCILCTRCIRVCDEVAKQPELTMAMRGDHEVLTTAPGRRLDNPYSLNTVDVRPVGALTSKDFRFTMRAWELESTPSVCPGCATGCNIEVHTSREQIQRLIPRENPYVNQHWMCDEGRFTYKRIYNDRLGTPLSRAARRRSGIARSRTRRSCCAPPSIRAPARSGWCSRRSRRTRICTPCRGWPSTAWASPAPTWRAWTRAGATTSWSAPTRTRTPRAPSPSAAGA